MEANIFFSNKKYLIDILFKVFKYFNQHKIFLLHQNTHCPIQ